MLSWSIEVVLDVIIVAWARLKNVVHVANHFIIAGEFQCVSLEIICCEIEIVYYNIISYSYH